MDIERSGIYKRFIKREKYITLLKDTSLLHVESSKNERLLLERYIKEGTFNYIYEIKAFGTTEEVVFNAQGINLSLQIIALPEFIMGLIVLLEGSNNFFQYQNGLFVIALSYKEKFYNKKLDKNLGMPLFLNELGGITGNILSQGWFDLALDMANQVNYFIKNDRDIFNDASDDYGRRRTQYFILRLINNWQGWSDLNYPKCAYDEPLFNSLIEEWRTEDMARIEHLLLCALDRHTHQCRPDNSKNFFDFSSGFYEYIPYEVLSVLRLREHLGLQNPVLEHILASTPLGQLHPITNPNDYMDDFLLGILKRVRQEYPDFADDLFGAGAPYEFEIKTKETNKWKFWKK